jgi:hypothetical protein
MKGETTLFRLPGCSSLLDIRNLNCRESNAGSCRAVLFEVSMSASPLNVPPSSLYACSPQFPAAAQDFQEKRAALLKHIAGSERLAEVRPASRLEVRPRPEMISTGVKEVDAITGGGIPRGCLTEIWGGASSGKTSLLLAAMSAATRQGETCVLIDASDSFDPSSGQAAGVGLRKLLWVRCGSSHQPLRLRSGQALAADRQAKQESHGKRISERRLEQVLKATDLILQSGGFGLIALDLAGIAEKFVRRIPLASWFRFQRAVEHTKSALLVLSETPCAQTCATLAVRVQQSAVSDQLSEKSAGKIQPSAVIFAPSERPAHAEILKDMRMEAEVMRSRLGRKPAQPANADFRSQAVRFG